MKWKGLVYLLTVFHIKIGYERHVDENLLRCQYYVQQCLSPIKTKNVTNYDFEVKSW